ncbi:MAG: hypothetical protein LBT81_05275 [Helicobacteraceae bacterium]|nr:hypothetical protein [Helicobacteraceae bacterium]
MNRRQLYYKDKNDNGFSPSLNEKIEPGVRLNGKPWYRPDFQIVKDFRVVVIGKTRIRLTKALRIRRSGSIRIARGRSQRTPL